MRCPAVTRQAEHAGVARCLLNRGRGSQCLGPPAARSAAGPQSTLLAALSPGAYQCKVWTQVFSRVLQLEPAAGTHQDSPGLPRCADARPKATCRSRPPAIIERSWRSDRRPARSQQLSSGEPDVSRVGAHVAFFVACRAAIASRSTLSSCARKFAQLCLISFAVERRGEIIGAPP